MNINLLIYAEIYAEIGIFPDKKSILLRGFKVILKSRVESSHISLSIFDNWFFQAGLNIQFEINIELSHIARRFKFAQLSYYVSFRDNNAWPQRH